jgi:hypothetical protein
MTRSRSLFALVAVLVLLGVVSCKTNTTKIEDIQDDPSRFGSELVRIEGEVKESVGLLGTGMYEVDDGTGTMTVVSKAGGVPSKGAHVGVEGTIKPGFTIGTVSYTVLMEEKRVLL